MLLGVGEDWSYVRAARGWLGVRTERRCRLTPFSGLSRKAAGGGLLGARGPGGAACRWVFAGPAGGVEGGGLCRRSRRQETLGRTPPFPPRLSSASQHITAVEETDLPVSLFPARLPPPPALITPRPHSVRDETQALSFQHRKGRLGRRPLGQEGLTHEVG